MNKYEKTLTVLFLKRTWHHSYLTYIRVVIMPRLKMINLFHLHLIRNIGATTDKKDDHSGHNHQAAVNPKAHLGKPLLKNI